MFANVIRLELAKQRKTFLSGMFAAALFLFFIIFESTLRNRNVLEVLRDLMGYFALFGMPALLILTGPIAASQLRSESVRNAEEPLPFHPIQKVFGAYLTSLLYLLIGSLLFIGGAFILNSIKTVDLPVPPVFIVLAIFQFHILAFLFAYWINQTILGTALAALILGIETMILQQAENQSHWLGYYSYSFSNTFWPAWIILGPIAGVIGAIAALWIISKRVEIGARTFFAPGLVTSSFLSFGIIVLSFGLVFTSYKLQNKLAPATDYFMQWSQYFSKSELQSGAFFGTASNGLVRITPEKRQILMEPHFRLNPKAYGDTLVIALGADSTFWLVLRDENSEQSNTYEIWKSASSGKLERYSTFRSPIYRPDYFVDCDGKICIYGYSEYSDDSGRQVAIAELSSNQTEAQTLHWQRIPVPEGYSTFATAFEHHLRPAIQAGLVAVLSVDHRTLVREMPRSAAIEWKLPGEVNTTRVLGSVVFPAYQKNGEPYFAIPVTQNDRTTIVLCSPDGSVSSIWDDSWLSAERIYPRAMPGGKGWIRWEGQKLHELLLVTGDGVPYRLPMSGFKRIDRSDWPSLLRIKDAFFWMLLDGRLLKFDLREKKVLSDSGNLHMQQYYRVTTKEGLYFISNDRICLIDWDGKIRDLGAATLN